MAEIFNLGNPPPVPNLSALGYKYGVISNVLNGWGDEQPYLLILCKSPFECKAEQIDGIIYERLVWEVARPEDLSDEDWAEQKKYYTAYYKYNESTGTWGDIQYPNWEYINLSNNEQVNHQLIWSNKDIFKDDQLILQGEFYPYNAHRVYQLIGFLTGAKTKLYRERALTGLNYGKVTLPTPPDWENDEYKYAIITHAVNGWTGAPYLLICFKEPPKYIETEVDGGIKGELIYGNDYPFYYKCQDGIWFDRTAGSTWKSIILFNRETQYHDLIWTSNDIYTVADGEVYFENQAPAPVYGSE